MSEFPVLTTELSEAQNKQISTPTSIMKKRDLYANSRHVGKESYLDWFLRNQIATSLSIIGATIFLYIFHEPSRVLTEKLLFLSYASPTENSYKQGIDDIYYVLAWVINFTAIRAISIDWILRPTAGYLSVQKKYRMRFAEQGWLVMYYTVFWSMGMYLWINSEYWLNNKAIWVIWPAREMSGLFKWYNLVQLSFWLQQILVIHLEKRRKDHAQMLTHHIITCTLISITYAYRYTRAANVVLCLMDVVDLLFPIAKILRYLCYENACNITFGIFVITWLIARHAMYLQLCWDIYTDVPSPSTMLFGCYQGGSRTPIPSMPAQPDYFTHLLGPFKSGDGIICLNTQVKWIFLGMLLFLQTLSLMWFTMIMKVVVAILRGQNAEDTRSEDEDEFEEELADGKGSEGARKSRPINMTDLDICVSSGGGMEAPMTLSTRPRTTNARRRPGVLEKEILNRIGCEKPQ